MSLSSKELNYLIWRYFQESGLELTTYALQKEAAPHTLEDELGPKTPMGTLVRLVQKGIQLSVLEKQVHGAKIGRTEDAYALIELLDSDLHKDLEDLGPAPATMRSKPRVELVEQAKTPAAQCGQWTSGAVAFASSNVMEIMTFHGENGTKQENDTKQNETEENGTDQDQDARTKGTSTAKTSIVHPEGQEVTALAWSPDGHTLVSATYDGQLRVWDRSGALRTVLSYHRLPVVAVAWNRSGSHVLSLDCANGLAIWDSVSGELRQTLQHMPASTLSELAESALGNDVDWVDDTTFITTGANSQVLAYHVGEMVPLKRFVGHTQGVNSIRHDPTTQRVCSGSDDYCVRIWDPASQTALAVLEGHSAPVVAVRWLQVKSVVSALDPQASPVLVVSASLDGSIKLWDTTTCIETLAAHHASSVLCCELSADGQRMASGDANGLLVVWDLSPVVSGRSSVVEVARFEGKSAITVLAWAEGQMDRLFVSFSDRAIVLDLVVTNV